MSGGGTTSTQQTTLSPWMEEAAKTQLGKATALTDINQNPYKEYTGQRIAEFNPMRSEAYRFSGVPLLHGRGAEGLPGVAERLQRLNSRPLFERSVAQ